MKGIGWCGKVCFIVILFFVACVNAAFSFSLTSKDITNNNRIATLHTCDGKNLSPALNWSNIPPGTKSYAVILNSPDWTVGNVFLWIIYNLPPSIQSLPQGTNTNHLPEGAKAGANFYNEDTFRGPCPPDDKLHHYDFAVYALNDLLDLPSDATGDDILIEINKHKLAEAHLTALYNH